MQKQQAQHEHAEHEHAEHEHEHELGEYKLLEIPFINCLAENDREAIRQFNARIPKKNMQLQIKKQKIQVLLKEIDFYHIQTVVEEITKKYHSESNILTNIANSIAAVKSYGIKGKKRIYANYNNERKVQGRSAKVEKRGQYYYAKEENFSQVNQKIQAKYIDKIICGDSENILEKIKDNSVDLILTSPPYNFGLEYKEGENKQEQDDKAWQIYFEKLFAIFDQCIRVLKYGGRIIVNVQPLFSDYIPTHHIVSQHCIKRKLIWKGEILWEKNNYNCKYTAWGSWKSPSSPYLKYTWEFLEIFCKGSLKKDGTRENIDISADEFKKWVVGKWAIAPERAMNEFGHPAMFPEELARRVIKLFSYRGDIILDPFNGVGTTSSVARSLQRLYIGIDTSEVYCEKARERISSTLQH